MPAENRFVATCTLGEGWHNYHHAFPFDYKAEEKYDYLNVATKLIRFFNYIGWATDLREATPDMVKSISKRLGDGRGSVDISSDCSMPSKENERAFG